MLLDENYLDENGNPSCLSNGDYIYTCANGCGKQEINLGGETNNGSRHAGYTKGVYVTAPTCIKNALYHCQDCDTDFYAYEDDTDAQATGAHIWTDTATVYEASCEQYGYEEYTCTCDADCTAVNTIITSDKLEHELELTDFDTDTYTCSICDAEFRNSTVEILTNSMEFNGMMVEITGIKPADPDKVLNAGTLTTITAENISMIYLKGDEDTTYTITLKDVEGNVVDTFTLEIGNATKDFDIQASAQGTTFVDISEVADVVTTIEITATADAAVALLFAL